MGTTCSQLIKRTTNMFRNHPASFVLIIVPLIVLLRERLSTPDIFFSLGNLPELLMRVSGMPSDLVLQAFASLTCLVAYILTPAAIHYLLPAPGGNDLGLTWGRSTSVIPFVVLMIAIMWPVAWVLGGMTFINSFYPFYRPLGLRFWLFYEFVYLLRIFSTEFFFRGFLLFRLENYFGEIAVLLVTIPYVFIHLNKPLPEALGSILAGVFLGVLALLCRSIWPGVLIHGAAALFIDISAAAHTSPVL